VAMTGTFPGMNGQSTPMRLVIVDDHQMVLDGLKAMLRPVQVIGLVDEQHAAHGALEHLLGLRRGVAHVLADQVVAGHADELPGAQVSQLFEQFTHARRQRGLPGSWAARKAHMQARPRRREAETLPQPVDKQQRGDLPHPVLDRRQPDELSFEPVQQRRDAQRLFLRVQVDLGVRWQRRRLFGLARPGLRRGGPGPRHGETARRGVGAHQPARAPFCPEEPVT